VYIEVVKRQEAMAEFGHRFLPLYHFDVHTGSWTHEQGQSLDESLSLAAAIESCGCEPTALPMAERQQVYARYLSEARDWADHLAAAGPCQEMDLTGELGELQFFSQQQRVRPE